MIPETEFINKNILANGYFIISNWDKNQSFINIDPDIIDSSISLNNSDAQYKLICNNIVIDTADDGNGTPLAGALKEDGWYNRSMSRKSPAVDGTATGSWCDAGTKYNLDGDRDEYATPGAINVCKEDAENPGSLKICKYEDADGDYLNTTNDQTALADWAFQIFNGITTSTATTTIDGCVIIENLIPGDYRITENIKNNWYIASANRQGHTFNIVQNQETRVDFYNTEYSTIYGYKYEDLDNSTSTDEYLQNPVKGWTINLFDNSATSTPLFFTSTDQSGYFEFNNLIPGVYIISEETQNGWTALSATSTFFTLFSGTATSTNFINYFESGTGGPEPEQKTETSDSGGSNFITRPDLKLDFEYLTEKNIDLSYTEKIIITNTGNIILTNGTLSVNLPENKLKFIDTGLNSAAFNIAALGVDNTFIATFTVTAIGEGEAITNVNINFDQISDKGQMIETITSANGVGNGPEKQETVTKTPAETQAIQPQSQGQTGNIQGEAAGTGETEQKIEQKNLPEIKGDQIFEIKDINGSGCVWWNWLLIIFLFIIVNGGYFLIMRENE